ncbi:hypothetical protein GCM10023184_43890 [Flaviaesturariibacter amylovorans]|uniref:RHS repeat protein n=2 Tax=Flaviaesturariibacter amylovorans TaxID=1084520 RepID=A0ABP8HS76_9BACT
MEAPPYEPPRLLQVVGIDSTRAVPNDTISRVSYIYDAQGRTTEVHSVQLRGARDTSSYTRQLIDYAGGDTLASRSLVMTRATGADTRFDTIYYGHRNGVRVYDSIRTAFASGMTATRVRRRTFTATHVIDSVTLVQDDGVSGPDSTYEVRRIWQQRVGIYFLRQLDSTVAQGPLLQTFRRQELNVTPSVIPNPVYRALRGITDVVADEQTSTFPDTWALQYLPEATLSSHKSWEAGMPGSVERTESTTYQVTTDNSSFPVRMTVRRTVGSAVSVRYYRFLYR